MIALELYHLLRGPDWPRPERSERWRKLQYWLLLFFEELLRDERSWSLVVVDDQDSEQEETVTARLGLLLLECGLLMSPATERYSIPTWFPLFRYIDCFAEGTAELLWDLSVKQWDARLLTIASEDLGVGVCGWLARTRLRHRHICDARPMLQTGELQYHQPPVSPKHPRLCPDFYAEGGQYGPALLEAKGAFGPPSSLGSHDRARGDKRSAQIPHGKLQVSNVDVVVGGQPVAADRFVIATSLNCQHDKRRGSPTKTFLVDPVRHDPDISPSDLPDLPIRLSYAKALCFGGAELFAVWLIEGMEWPSGMVEIETAVVETRLGRFVAFGLCPFGGLLALDEAVWLVLAAGQPNIRSGVHRALQDLDRRTERHEDAWVESQQIVVLNNGVALLLGGDVRHELRRSWMNWACSAAERDSFRSAEGM